MKALIVEDSKYTLMALEEAVKKVFPKHFASYTLDVAKCYNEAEQMTEKPYDFVLLDNSMPRENTGDLEKTDFDKFSELQEEIGYTLIPKIKNKNPKCIVVGTSNMHQDDLRRFQKPDFTLRKLFNYAEEDLEKILREK